MSKKRCIIITFSPQWILYCFSILSLWIFIIIIGLYTYMGYDNNEPLKSTPKMVGLYAYGVSREIHKQCAPINELSMGTEYIRNSTFSLEGVLIIFRHGDRGPINHVQNMEIMNCNSTSEKETNLYNKYAAYVSSHLNGQFSNSLYQYTSTSVPHLPYASTNKCEIGQLTINGFIQHLKLGSLFRSVYFDKLLFNDTVNGDIYTYSSKYRRTYQSLSAFLYGLLGENFHKIHLNVVNSLYFCFEDCACPAVSILNKKVRYRNYKRRKSQHASVNFMKQIQNVSNFVYTMTNAKFNKDPYNLRDALLTYICHNLPLPCSSHECIQSHFVSNLFSYINLDLEQNSKSKENQQIYSLYAYGLFKSLVFHILKIASNEKPKFVIYSAHDKTLTYLLTTLGILTSDVLSPIYASRAVFEVYSHLSLKKYFFRLIYNGKDLTRKIKFCKNADSTSHNASPNNFMCSIESFIRFLHDDYFSLFNVVNFKDACMLAKH